MATIITVGSGYWSSTINNSPWPNGVLPIPGIDKVIINASHTITILDSRSIPTIEIGGTINGIATLIIGDGINAITLDLGGRSIKLVNGVSSPVLTMNAGVLLNLGDNGFIDHGSVHNAKITKWNINGTSSKRVIINGGLNCGFYASYSNYYGGGRSPENINWNYATFNNMPGTTVCAVNGIWPGIAISNIQIDHCLFNGGITFILGSQFTTTDSTIIFTNNDLRNYAIKSGYSSNALQIGKPGIGGLCVFTGNTFYTNILNGGYITWTANGTGNVALVKNNMYHNYVSLVFNATSDECSHYVEAGTETAKYATGGASLGSTTTKSILFSDYFNTHWNVGSPNNSGNPLSKNAPIFSYNIIDGSSGADNWNMGWSEICYNNFFIGPIQIMEVHGGSPDLKAEFFKNTFHPKSEGSAVPNLGLISRHENSTYQGNITFRDNLFIDMSTDNKIQYMITDYLWTQNHPHDFFKNNCFPRLDYNAWIAIKDPSQFVAYDFSDIPHLSSPIASNVGVDDIFVDGNYSWPGITNYKFVIDGVGTPNTYKWSKDNGVTWVETNKSMTTTWVDIDLNPNAPDAGTWSGAVPPVWIPLIQKNIVVKWASTTGHTLGGSWSITASRILQGNDLFGGHDIAVGTIPYSDSIFVGRATERIQDYLNIGSKQLLSYEILKRNGFDYLGNPGTFDERFTPGLIREWATNIYTIKSSALMNSASDNGFIGATAPLLDAPPVITNFNIPSTNYSLRISNITITTTDDNNAVNGYFISESNTAPLSYTVGWVTNYPTTWNFSLPYGSKTLYAWAKDAVGNISDVKSATTLLIDNTPPIVTRFIITPPDVGQLIVNLSVMATDVGGSGVNGYFISESITTPDILDNNWTIDSPTTHSFSTYGIKTLYVWAKDNSGNISEFSSLTITLLEYVDNTPPTITAFTVSSSTQLSVPVSITTDNVGITYYTITESNVQPTSNWGTSSSFVYTTSSAGTKTLYPWAKDDIGNISTVSNITHSVTFILTDSTPPIVDTFIIPSVSNSLILETIITAHDNSSIAGYKVTSTSSTPNVNDGWSSTPPTTITSPTTGSITFYAWAKDNAGNISNGLPASTIITLIDITHPIINSFNIPSSITIPIPGQVAVSFEAFDNMFVNGYILSDVLDVVTSDTQGWTSVSPSQSISIDTVYTFTQSGLRTFNLWVRDSSGNISSVASKNINITQLATNLDVQAVITAILNTPLVEDYTINGNAPTLSQAIFMMLQLLSEKSITGSIMNVNKIDRTHTAMQFKLNNPTNPTSITRIL